MFTSAPAVCAWGGGRLEVFGRGLDGQLYHCSLTGGGPQPAQWEALGGRLTGPASVVAWDERRLDIFALDTNRGCVHKAWNGTDWLPSQLEWESLGGPFVTTPVAVSCGPGRIDVFGVGPDASLVHKAWTGSSWTPGWEALGGRLSHRPAVATWGPDRLDVFAVQINGGMYHKSWEGNGWHPSAHDWESLGGIFTTAPAVVAWEPGRLDVFGCGLDRTCYHKAWDVTGWHPSTVAWDHLTDDFRDGNPLDRTVVFTSDPIAITTAPGRFDVFGFNVDRNAIRSRGTANGGRRRSAGRSSAAPSPSSRGPVRDATRFRCSAPPLVWRAHLAAPAWVGSLRAPWPLTIGRARPPSSFH